MKVVLATGIYPPEIGGPATYVFHLARGLVEHGVRVTVIAYGSHADAGDTPVIRVSRSGGPIARWRRYSKALKEHARDADIVYAFSSVSVGVPLWMSGLKHPKKVLRLGGDFLWERYTDRGGLLSLKEWYAEGRTFRGAINGILKQFEYIVFSSAFQEELYNKNYQRLPLHSVIENALPSAMPVHHAAHNPFKLLFLGRFVSFKNLGSLIIAMEQLPQCTLTLVGSGPLGTKLRSLVHDRGLGARITFVPPLTGDSKQQAFHDHDLLVLPSYTEISPNSALEARAAGLPVLLTAETGLSHLLTVGAQLRPLRSPEHIVNAIQEVIKEYDALADRASSPLPQRSWDDVTNEHLALFRQLL